MSKKIAIFLVLFVLMISSVLAIMHPINRNNIKAVREDIKQETANNSNSHILNKHKVLKQNQIAKINPKLRNRLDIAIGKCVKAGLTREECKKRIENRVLAAKNLGIKKVQELRNIQNLKIERLKKLSQLSKLVKVDPKKGLTARKIEKAKLEKIRNNYLKERKKYLDLKKKYLNRRKEFNELKQQLKKCKNSTTEECNSLRKKAREQAKATLLDATDVLINNLNKLKDRIESSEELNDSFVESSVEKINNEIKKLTDLRNEVENLPENATKQQIKELARKIAKEAKGIKWKMLDVHARRLNKGIGIVLFKAQQLGIRLDKLLDYMSEKGIDITELYPLVVEYHGFVDNATSSYDEARTLFKQAKDNNSDELIKRAEEKVKETKDYLKKARRTLAEIHKKITKMQIGKYLHQQKAPKDPEKELKQEQELNQITQEITDETATNSTDNSSAEGGN